MRRLIAVTSTDEWCQEECRAALLEIDADQAKCYLDLIEKAKKAKEDDSDFFYMAYWDVNLTYLQTRDETRFDDGERDLLKELLEHEIVEPSEDWSCDLTDSDWVVFRTDADTVLVDERGARWRAYVKGDDMPVETASVPAKVLHEIAES